MVAESVAEAADWRAQSKVKTPPSTGSTGLLAATVTASGLANASADGGGLGGAAGDGGEREPLALEGADVGVGRVERLAALVGGDRVVVPG